MKVRGYIRSFITEGQDTSTDEVEQQMIEEQTKDASQVGIVVDTDRSDSTICWYLAQFDASGFMVILVGIFMSILACGEHDSGFLKNLSSCSQHKWQIVTARLLPGFLCTVLLQLALFVSMLLFNVLYGSHIMIGNLLELLPVIAVQILLHTAFAAFVLVVAEISRSLLISILVSIFTGFGFAGLIVSFISNHLINFMILSRIKMTVLPLQTEFLPATIIVGAVTLIGYLFISGLVFQKRDTY